jgi:hypothetical protein
VSDVPRSGAYERFVASMAIGYDEWHDGIGYDIAAIAEMPPERLADVERLLLPRWNEDWRDIEALAALGAPAAAEALRRAMTAGSIEIRNAVMRHAPELTDDDERIASLVDGIERAEIYGGLTQTLLQVEDFHPQPVVDAVLRGAAHRAGDVAIHLAAMALFLHGQADSSFDTDQRPFLLRFAGPDGPERRAVFAELCSRIGVDPERYR